MPAVAAMVKPSSTNRRAASTPPALSRSASERNTVPALGQPVARRDLALGEGQAEGEVDAHDLAGRAHLRARARVSASGKRLNGQHRLLHRDVAAGRPAARSRPSSRSSASVAPTITRAATLTSGTPVALATNGTVRAGPGVGLDHEDLVRLAPRTAR